MIPVSIQNTLLQLTVFVGAVYLVGYLVYLCNRLFYSMTGNSRTVCLATGIIGTPIHELSHAILCIVFGHRITELKLYQIDDESGTLGYVNHSYNPKNLYHQIGNYFIGVAPLFGGSAFLYLMMTYFAPAGFEFTNSLMAEILAVYEGRLGLELIPVIFSAVFAILRSIFFGGFNLKTVIFIIIAFCVALHMNLSGADIKGSIKPLPILALILLVVNVALSLVSKTVYATFLRGVFTVSCYLLVFLTMSLILSVIILLLGLLKKIKIRR